MHRVTSRFATMENLHELHFGLLPHPPCSPDLAPRDYYLFEDLKRILQGKRFVYNEEVVAETEAYFEATDKSFYKKGIEMLEKHWNECIPLKETMLMNEVEFCLKVVLSVILRTY